MNLEHKVLPSDLTDAVREHECQSKCLFLAWRAAKHGEYEVADDLVGDAYKSRRELDKLMQRKIDHDLAGEFLTVEAIERYEMQMRRGG